MSNASCVTALCDTYRRCTQHSLPPQVRKSCLLLESVAIGQRREVLKRLRRGRVGRVGGGKMNTLVA